MDQPARRDTQGRPARSSGRCSPDRGFGEQSARERRERINRLAALPAHLRLSQHHAERGCTSGRLTLNQPRRQLALLPEDSPSLAQRLPEFIERVPAATTRAPRWRKPAPLQPPFPKRRAYSVDRIIDEAFWPEG
jgi:hypothetical protein